jgi:hypothetical protein
MFKLIKRDRETIAKTRDMLLSMRGKIEYLQDIEVYTTIRQEPISYDLMMITNIIHSRILRRTLPIRSTSKWKTKDVIDSVAAVM